MHVHVLDTDKKLLIGNVQNDSVINILSGDPAAKCGSSKVHIEASFEMESRHVSTNKRNHGFPFRRLGIMTVYISCFP
jgi:hypothetical protein